MSVLRFDSVGGASGDMILAALIDLGADLKTIRARLDRLPVEPFTIEAAPREEGGLHGTRVEVRVGGHAAKHSHAHGAGHTHAAHGRAGRAKSARRPAHGSHEHRDLADILRLIAEGGLPRRVAATSSAVFRRLAEAEARVHGTTPDEVEFHEVGAVDSIVDIVGGCLALELLGAQAVDVGPLPLGRGTTRCRHGVIPVPVPATVELLKGMPVVATDEPFELVTPTGAALLSTWRTLAAVPAVGRIARAGAGFGHRTLRGRPNLLRAMLLEAEQAPAAGADRECAVLECNVDDTVPQLLGALTESLMAAGALDVFVTPVQMKKQRPGALLTVLSAPADAERLTDLVFRGSTTFGVREYRAQRTVLARRHVRVSTPYGAARVKLGEWKGRVITRAPEYEDCAALARAAKVNVRAVFEAAQRAALALDNPERTR